MVVLVVVAVGGDGCGNNSEGEEGWAAAEEEWTAIYRKTNDGKVL